MSSSPDDFEDTMFRCVFAGIATIVLGLCALGAVALAIAIGVVWSVLITAAAVALFRTLYRRIEL